MFESHNFKPVVLTNRNGALFTAHTLGQLKGARERGYKEVPFEEAERLQPQDFLDSAIRPHPKAKLHGYFKEVR